jgi:hypothetical protein
VPASPTGDRTVVLNCATLQQQEYAVQLLLRFSGPVVDGVVCHASRQQRAVTAHTEQQTAIILGFMAVPRCQQASLSGVCGRKRTRLDDVMHTRNQEETAGPTARALR